MQKTSTLFQALGALAGLSLFALVACGGGDSTSSGGGDGGAVDGDGSPIFDADPLAPDADPNQCSATGVQCNNCIDDDGDGKIDGDDIECASNQDRDESSFATGIPGDNIDAKIQDCFFDGNSGSGNDGCRYHTCCILGAASEQECPADLHPYDPKTDCEVSAQCIENCGPLTPPGCDCFGCCTLCDGEGCVDVFTNPAIAPECDETLIHDDSKCPTCVKTTECGSSCDPKGCILCPGMSPDDLPAECQMSECPGTTQVCDPITMPCGPSSYCSNGCCVAIID